MRDERIKKKRTPTPSHVAVASLQSLIAYGPAGTLAKLPPCTSPNRLLIHEIDKQKKKKKKKSKKKQKINLENLFNKKMLKPQT